VYFDLIERIESKYSDKLDTELVLKINENALKSMIRVINFICLFLTLILVLILSVKIGFTSLNSNSLI
jgi:hypothetical protein